MTAAKLPISDVSRGVLVALLLALLFVGGIFAFSQGPRLKVSRIVDSIEANYQEDKGRERQNGKRRPDLDNELPIHRLHPTGQTDDAAGGGGGGAAAADAGAGGRTAADAPSALREALRKYRGSTKHTYDITISAQGRISGMGKRGLSFLDGVPAEALNDIRTR